MKNETELPDKISLPWPLTCESTDAKGRWCLVNLLDYLGAGKWSGFDEDGKPVVVDAKTLSCPTMSPFTKLDQLEMDRDDDENDDDALN